MPNALDFTGADPDRRVAGIEEDIAALRELGAQVELVNLRDYFGKQGEFAKKFNELRAILICGGNVFVLRQPMMLIGADGGERAVWLHDERQLHAAVLKPSPDQHCLAEPGRFHHS